ncbi:MAG: hypothetical protein HY736_27785 [Verrucomicrobia bacterium]|nr:hypothetical protein [Verrucomicrobiota bacterium]
MYAVASPIRRALATCAIAALSYAAAINVTAVPMVFQGPMPGRRDSISDHGCKVTFGISGRY